MNSNVIQYGSSTVKICFHRKTMIFVLHISVTAMIPYQLLFQIKHSLKKIKKLRFIRIDSKSDCFSRGKRFA